MKVKGFKVLFSLFSIGAVVVLGVVPMCSPTKPAPDPFAGFIISNQITGWALRDSVSHFSAATLYTIVNGGDYSYIENPKLIAGIHSDYDNNTKNTTGSVFVIDYGMADSAKAEYLKLKTRRTSGMQLVPISSYSDTCVVAIEVGGGASCYAWFGKYFFQMDFTGYSATTDAAADIASFLAYYQTKTN